MTHAPSPGEGRRPDEAGSAALELVLLTPILLVLLLLVVAGGRLAATRSQVDAAARDAARTGTIARSPAVARRQALDAVRSRLDAGSVGCRALVVDVDTSAFRAGGQVATTVTCVVDLGDLTLLRVPGARTVTARAVEPLDTYRGISGGFSNSEGVGAANPRGGGG